MFTQTLTAAFTAIPRTVMAAVISTHAAGEVSHNDSMAAPTLTPSAGVGTPPSTTDEASHKESDDAASSSSLSELGDDILDEENRRRFEEAARAGAEAEQHTEIKPHHYENNIPIFQPVCHSTGNRTRLVILGNDEL